MKAHTITSIKWYITSTLNVSKFSAGEYKCELADWQVCQIINQTDFPFFLLVKAVYPTPAVNNELSKERSRATVATIEWRKKLQVWKYQAIEGRQGEQYGIGITCIFLIFPTFGQDEVRELPMSILVE